MSHRKKTCVALCQFKYYCCEVIWEGFSMSFSGSSVSRIVLAKYCREVFLSSNCLVTQLVPDVRIYELCFQFNTCGVLKVLSEGW